MTFRSAGRSRVMALAFAAVFLLLAVAACGSDSSPQAAVEASANVERFRVVIIAEYPHDADAFTQGLAFDDGGRLFESTGGYGTSEVRELDLESGSVKRSERLDDELFGEGLTVVGNELIQLTWKSGRVLHWDAETFDLLAESTIDGEGWGVTTIGSGSRERLFVSNGSSTISKYSIDEFEPFKDEAVEVRTNDGEAIDNINELETVGSTVYANIWLTSEIALLDAESGELVGILDATELSEAQAARGIATDDGEVLNGIAHRPGDDPTRLFLTGKRWDAIYEVDVVPA